MTCVRNDLLRSRTQEIGLSGSTDAAGCRKPCAQRWRSVNDARGGGQIAQSAASRVLFTCVYRLEEEGPSLSALGPIGVTLCRLYRYGERGVPRRRVTIFTTSRGVVEVVKMLKMVEMGGIRP